MKKVCLINKKSFTLFESVVSLFIVSLTILLMIPCLKIMHMDITKNNETVNFFSYLGVIESSRFDFQFIKQDDNKITLYSSKNKNIYYLKTMNQSIVMSTISGGYIPIMQNIKQIHWQYDKKINCLTTILITNDGELFHSKSNFILKKM